MRLLVVTDHTYHRTGEGVFDTYCFDRGFFDDYRAVFESVHVVARMNDGARPEHSHRSDGDGVEFVDLPNVHGPKWALAPSRTYCGALDAAMAAADAVCVRTPAVAGYFAARLAKRRGKPLMFEQVGDPIAATAADRARYGLVALPFGYLMGRRTRWIARHADAGSYVSRAHLQRRYPAAPGVPTESVSSIRLPDAAIRPARRFAAAPSPLKLVLTASLLPVKDHPTLLRGMRRGIDLGAPLMLDLLGGGGAEGELMGLAESLGLADRVVFHGHVAGRARIDALLDAADLFVMTSINEGMPRSMIEAMARGLPAIGSDAGGIAEILPQEQRFGVGDAGRLGERLAALQRDPETLTRYAAHSETTAREFALSILSARRRRLLEVLRARAEGR